MNPIIDYFHPQEFRSYFNKLKTGFFIRICLIGTFLILGVSVIDMIYQSDNFLVTILSRLAMVVFLILSLFILKQKGIKWAGNFFVFGSFFVVLFSVNILSTNVDVTYKFVQGFYSICGLMSLAGLFATRPVILINFILALATTIRVFIFMLHHQPEQTDLLTAGFINHTLIFFAIVIIVYFSNRFMELTINKANDEILLRELQNKELLSTEEEIRASNEELVATTDALVDSNEDLTEAMKKAEESDRLKTEFLNNMSHEVRTPMNGIIGFSQLLDIPDLSDGVRRKYINTIQQSSHQLLSILDNIIEISKLGTKQVKVVEQQIHINKMLSDLFVVFENALKDKPVSLDLVLDLAENEDEIRVDEIKLYKILSNLLENAVKFTEKGSVTFGYKILKDHSLDYKRAAIQFFVKDTGIGIQEEKQELIFNKFSQGDSELNRQYGGLGLGLSIAKDNTELLHGHLSIASVHKEGSTFYVTIPYKAHNQA